MQLMCAFLDTIAIVVLFHRDLLMELLVIYAQKAITVLKDHHLLYLVQMVHFLTMLELKFVSNVQRDFTVLQVLLILYHVRKDTTVLNRLGLIYNLVHLEVLDHERDYLLNCSAHHALVDTTVHNWVSVMLLVFVNLGTTVL